MNLCRVAIHSMKTSEDIVEIVRNPTGPMLRIQIQLANDVSEVLYLGEKWPEKQTTS